MKENPWIMVRKRKILRNKARLAHTRDRSDVLVKPRQTHMPESHEKRKSTVVAKRGCGKYPTHQDTRVDAGAAKKAHLTRH